MPCYIQTSCPALAINFMSAERPMPCALCRSDQAVRASLHCQTKGRRQSSRPPRADAGHCTALRVMLSAPLHCTALHTSAWIVITVMSTRALGESHWHCATGGAQALTEAPAGSVLVVEVLGDAPRQRALIGDIIAHAAKLKGLALLAMCGAAIRKTGPRG